MSEEEFVPLMSVRNITEAEHCKTVLEDHEIPVEIEKDPDLTESDYCSKPTILVPSDLLEEAQHVIERQAALDEELEQNFTNFTGDDKGDNNYDYDSYAELHPEEPDSDIDLEDFDNTDDEEIF